MADKKVVATSSKALLWLLFISVAINVILILSGLKFNPYLLLIAILIIAGFLFYLYKKPKQLDFFSVVALVRKRYHEYYGYWLDPTDAQGWPISADVSLFYFPWDAATFYFDVAKQKIYGKMPRHLLKAIREQEKSGLFASTQRYLGAEAQLRQAAEALGADTEKLGLDKG